MGEPFQTLISTSGLKALLDGGDADAGALVVVGCRFDLADTGAGAEAYRDSHIPTAVYAHLERDLSGPAVTDHGRHPLPPPETLIERFGRLGIGGDPAPQVVVYDASNGAYAARLWWMLRYMGHEAVAVLDGGWQAWLGRGYPTNTGDEHNTPRAFTGAPRREWLVLAADVEQAPLLVDSRGPERYRGELEPLDPVAGHIPGAVNYYYQENWTPDSVYLDEAQMRAQMQQVLGDVPPSEAVFYCGSGVTACVNLLALSHAGLGDGRLYVGSWSEWSRDESRPIAGQAHVEE